MIKRISKALFALIFISLTFSVEAQIYHPIHWSWHQKKVSANEIDLIFRAKIDKPWHLYAQEIVKDGPIPTSFHFDSLPKNYILVGKTKEQKPLEEAAPVFNNAILKFYKGSATFTQRIKIIGKKDFKLAGYLEFMTCNDKQCLPPEDKDFSFDIKAPAVSAAKNDKPTTTPNADQQKINQVQLNNSAQQGIVNPVHWQFSKTQINDSVYEFTATAKIDSLWHLYSKDVNAKSGLIPTSFVFDSSAQWVAVGQITETGKKIMQKDPSFDVQAGVYENQVVYKQKIKVLQANAVIKGHVNFMACSNVKCTPPQDKDFSVALQNQNHATISQAGSTNSSDNSNNLKNKSLWAIFLTGLGAGLLALITPCIYSMMPLTVSFFAKQSKTRKEGIRNALVYGISIIVIYVLLGVIVSAAFGSSALNAFATNVYFNLFIFIVFVLFAISFLGAFEFKLPSSWINKMDKMSDKGGNIGIFFMAATLVLVSFSCTVAYIGTLLVMASKGGIAGPIVGMFAFSLVLALPFVIFALFPAWLNNLPNSGGWLNTIMVFLGFLELALAFKFASNADLVVQARILTREIFLAIWIGIFLALTLYLFGVYRLPKDEKSDHISVGRLMVGILSLCFTIYLIPGMWGAPLKLISGFPPPKYYSESSFSFSGSSNMNVAENATQKTATIPKGAVPNECPYHLNCFHDYALGLAYAKKVHKPILLDFTGYACVNCRKMEQYVWPDPHVLSILRNDVVLISLYVDDKKSLPKAEQKMVKIGDEQQKLRTVGNKWSYLEASRYNQNTQPLYILIDLNEKKLMQPYSYDPDIQKFVDWLNKGKAKFEKE